MVVAQLTSSRRRSCLCPPLTCMQARCFVLECGMSQYIIVRQQYAVRLIDGCMACGLFGLTPCRAGRSRRGLLHTGAGLHDRRGSGRLHGALLETRLIVLQQSLTHQS